MQIDSQIVNLCVRGSSRRIVANGNGLISADNTLHTPMNKFGNTCVGGKIGRCAEYHGVHNLLYAVQVLHEISRSQVV